MSYAVPRTRRWTHLHRLRKYRRRCERALRTGRGDLTTLLVLKWRYWRKFFKHESLWK